MANVLPAMNDSMRSNQEIEQFLASVVLLLKENNVIGATLDEKTPVILFQHPEKLKETLGLHLGERGHTDVELLEICRKVVHYSVRTGSPNFHNQLYAGLDPYGLAGAWINEALNTNQHTFEVAPAFTLVEQVIIDRMLQLVGFKEGDGIFAPGGSMSNMYGIVAARYKKFPETKTKGMSGLPNLVLFTSEDSHYSVVKGAHWFGFGTENVIKVAVDSRGRMSPSALRASIARIRAEGRIPLMVNATAGTTVLGAFDPLEQVADVCSEEGIWLHVDACWGGSLIFSKKYNSVLNGLHRADSLSWNPHKMIGAPLQCSLFLIKQNVGEMLKSANINFKQASYKFK